MHKNILWLIFLILCGYFSLIYCEELTAVQDLKSNDSNDLFSNDTRSLVEEARTRRKHHHHLYSLWGFYGLAVAYLVKIKIIVVAFVVGSAMYLGLRYWWPHKCVGGGEIYKEGSVVLDHPPSFVHHDHIPYSLDHDQHHYDSGSFSGPASFEPYSAYSGHSLPESAESFPSSSFSGLGGPLDSLPSQATTFRRKRSQQKENHDKEGVTGSLENLARQMVVNEERIGDFMFAFLGLDTNACRRRFICEMEFKSKANPLTSMAFRVMGHSFFAKYINSENDLARANSFEECAAVNKECVFIENNEEAVTEKEEELSQEPVEEPGANLEEASVESNDVIEKENEENTKLEIRNNNYRKRLREESH